MLRDGRYIPLLADVDGVIRSETPGLWLDQSALLAGDMQRVLAVVQQGVSSSAHEGFVLKLTAAGLR